MSQKCRADKFRITAANKSIECVRYKWPFQYLGVFARIKWLEAIIIGASALILAILFLVLTQVP